MEDQEWVDEDEINKNMLSDQDQIEESHDSSSNDLYNLETQESTNSDLKGKWITNHYSKKNGLVKRSNKSGLESSWRN